MVEVNVRENDVEQALRRLKKVMNREKIFTEMRKRVEYIKPFEQRKLQKRMAERRIRKIEAKRRSEV